MSIRLGNEEDRNYLVDLFGNSVMPERCAVVLVDGQLRGAAQGKVYRSICVQPPGVRYYERSAIEFSERLRSA